MKAILAADGTAVWRVRLSPRGDTPAAAESVLIDPDGLRELTTILQRAAACDTCRVVILESTARGFCNGMDLGHIVAHPGTNMSQEVHAFARCMGLWRSLPKITLTLVDGPAFGGGLGLIAAADIAIATARSRFGLPEAVLGLVPSVVLPLILQRLPPQKARLLALSSSLDAERALTLGLIDQMVADPAELEKALRTAVKQALRTSPRAVVELKQLTDQVVGEPCDSALDLGAGQTAEVLANAENVDAIRAFLEGERLPWFDRYRPPGRES